MYDFHHVIMPSFYLLCQFLTLIDNKGNIFTHCKVYKERIDLSTCYYVVVVVVVNVLILILFNPQNNVICLTKPGLVFRFVLILRKI